MEVQTYLRRSEAARYLQERFGAYTAQTLAKLACVGGGPVYRKMGAYPVYRPADLDAWAEARMSAPVASSAELSSRRKDAA
ncbi:hypothetical protein EDF58_1146 [Novosphingobium sp. PhB57]|uniref:DNA-binding protein n=1 Tax=Novosphingobium sp. PhB57 TaxID=2485107 RepID=UPI0010535BFC|nr:DNA-binding protein [Novosphingobium sp. PhB57]TCU52748.1 hypothetical protein EDF58_1146 [Novosphingobium sp. PhB57]